MVLWLLLGSARAKPSLARCARAMGDIVSSQAVSKLIFVAVRQQVWQFIAVVSLD